MVMDALVIKLRAVPLQVLRCYMQHGLSAVPVSVTQKVIEGEDWKLKLCGSWMFMVYR